MYPVVLDLCCIMVTDFLPRVFLLFVTPMGDAIVRLQMGSEVVTTLRLGCMG